jgi:Cd2+/Zn2+-exporting ATPase
MKPEAFFDRKFQTEQKMMDGQKCSLEATLNRNNAIETTITIGGMDCPSCAEKIEKIVSRMKGVTSVAVDFTAGRLVVLSKKGTDISQIERQIEKLGYRIGRPSGGAVDKFFVEGMDCPDESSLIERKLRGLDGVKKVSFNLVAGEVTVSYDAHVLTREDVLSAIRQTGMNARPVDALRQSAPEDRDHQVHTVVSGAFVATGFALSALGYPHTFSIVFYLLAMLTGGYHIYRKAFYSVRSLTFDMNFLMTIAVIGAAAIDQWLEAATVVVFL